MAKTVIGIDVGLHSLKAVYVTGTAKSAQLTRVAMIPQTVISDSMQQVTEKAVAAQFKDLVARLKGGRGDCHFALNLPSAVLRIVDTPYFTQPEMRVSLKLNHQTYLRQSHDNCTFDGLCLFHDAEALKKPKKDKKTDADRSFKKGKSVIAGLPSSEVLICYMAAKRAGLIPQSLNLAAVTLINGFGSAFPQAFQEQSVLLLDIGHLSCSLTIISRGEIFLTRVVNLGGKNVLEHLAQSQGSAQAAEQAAAEAGELLAEAVQASLAPLMREVHSSVNFFERNMETDLNKIHVSGRLARAPVVLSLIQKEVGFPCEGWDPSEGMKNSLPMGQKELYAENQAAFAVAIGTARSALN